MRLQGSHLSGLTRKELRDYFNANQVLGANIPYGNCGWVHCIPLLRFALLMYFQHSCLH